MSEELPRSPGKSGLSIQRDAGLVNFSNGGFRPLSEIINRSLIHIQTSKALSMRHRLGEHELWGPDYRLVCAFAEDLRMTPEEVLRQLLSTWSLNTRWRTMIDGGRFKDLHIDKEKLPISSIPSIEGLVVESLDLRFLEVNPYPDFSMFPNLKHLGCDDNQLIELDLSLVPHLTMLGCCENRLTKLDLSQVPKLTILHCHGNQLAELDLSHVPNLKVLHCYGNQLTGLDLSQVSKLANLFCQDNQLFNLEVFQNPELTVLWCEGNQLTKLDLSRVPDLALLRCHGNHLSELDIRNLPNLRTLKYDPATRLIQRPDQNFK